MPRRGSPSGSFPAPEPDGARPGIADERTNGAPRRVGPAGARSRAGGVVRDDAVGARRARLASAILPAPSGSPRASSGRATSCLRPATLSGRRRCAPASIPPGSRWIRRPASPSSSPPPTAATMRRSRRASSISSEPPMSARASPICAGCRCSPAGARCCRSRRKACARPSSRCSRRSPIAIPTRPRCSSRAPGTRWCSRRCSSARASPRSAGSASGPIPSSRRCSSTTLTSAGRRAGRSAPSCGFASAPSPKGRCSTTSRAS